MGTVRFWSEQSPSLGDCIVVVPEDAEVASVIEEECTAAGARVALLRPTVGENRELFLFFLSYKYAEATVANEYLDSPSAQFIRCWEEFLDAVVTLDVATVRALKDKLFAMPMESLYLYRARDLILLLHRMTELLDDALNPGTLLPHIASPLRGADWWIHSTPLLKKISDLHRDLGQRDFCHAQASKRAMRSATSKFLPMQEAWKNKNIAEQLASTARLLCWSSHQAALAANPTLAVLLAHRSCDLILTSEAWDSGLLYFDGSRPRFTSDARLSPPERRQVSLMSTERELTSTGVLARDRIRLEFLSSLNQTRNSLIYTHGGYRCSAEEASWALRSLERLLEEIWRADQVVLSPPHQELNPALSRKLIFDFEVDFESFFAAPAML